MRPRLAVLISGRGSNLAALLAAMVPLEVVLVLSNVPTAAGLELARSRGIPTEVLDHREFGQRTDFDAALARILARHAPDLIVLAGFMRVLGPAFVAAHAGRLLNIHPSLLPAFPGLHTHRRALQEGVRLHGCTVHLVTAELDHGPILAQAAVPVLPDDDEERLTRRVLRCEHRIYPQVLRAWAEGRVSWDASGTIKWTRPDHSGAGTLHPEALSVHAGAEILHPEGSSAPAGAGITREPRVLLAAGWELE